MELNDLLSGKGFQIPVSLVPNKDDIAKIAKATSEHQLALAQIELDRPNKTPSEYHMAISEQYDAYYAKITAKPPLPVMPVDCEGCGHAMNIVSNDGIAVGKQCSNQACLKTYTYNVADFRKE